MVQKLFNEHGDREASKRRIVRGNSTMINDFNNSKYRWAVGEKNSWYRVSMNNFWIPEEIPMNQDKKDYETLLKTAPSLAWSYEMVLAFLIYLDSVQMHNLPNINEWITAPEVNLCLTMHARDEGVHSQSYSYILDSVCSPEKRQEILYRWADDKHLMKRNKFIGELYEEFLYMKKALENEDYERGGTVTEDDFYFALVKTCMANFILEGIYFYSGFLLMYNFGRLQLMSGTISEIKYINRDENTHLTLFRNILVEMRRENPELFTPERIEILRGMVRDAVEQEVEWGKYVLNNSIDGLSDTVIERYICYIANQRLKMLGFDILYPNVQENPIKWVEQYADINGTKTDFFEQKVLNYSKSSAVEDDL